MVPSFPTGCLLHPHASQQGGWEHLVYICQSWLWMTTEAVFISHVDASTGSRCERKITKQRKLLNSLQTANWQEGRNNYYCATQQKLLLLPLLSSIPAYITFIFRALWIYIQYAGLKGELELSSTPSAAHNILLWTRPPSIFMLSLWF